jgi:hypothetical protein
MVFYICHRNPSLDDLKMGYSYYCAGYEVFLCSPILVHRLFVLLN